MLIIVSFGLESFFFSSSKLDKVFKALCLSLIMSKIEFRKYVLSFLDR